MLRLWRRHLRPGWRLALPGLCAAVARGGVAEMGPVRRVRQVAQAAARNAGAASRREVEVRRQHRRPCAQLVQGA